MDPDKLIFEDSPFDTEHFGYRCAIVSIANSVQGAELMYELIWEKAKACDIRFLTVVAERPIPHLSQYSSGTLYEYEGSFRVVKSLISNFPRRFHIVPITDECWADVLDLSHYRSGNRFSFDSHFNKHAVYEHKVKLYKRQCELFPQLAFIAYANDGQPLGFHIGMNFIGGDSANSDSALIQYDLVVKPDYRIGAVAMDLVSACIHGASEAAFSPTRVLTKIYDDNQISSNFFRKIGLNENGKQYNYYHLWF
jgi:hypothetical protein